jgi:predicted nuclease of restriction endonuclease-like (RecB) superfamily
VDLKTIQERGMQSMKLQNVTQNGFLQRIVNLLHEARKSVVRGVNQTMVHTYFTIGRMIVEHEQGGKTRAEYGGAVLRQLSKRLTKEFGRGFSVDNLQNMRQFYLTYSIALRVSARSGNSKYETVSRKFALSQNLSTTLTDSDQSRSETPSRKLSKGQTVSDFLNTIEFQLSWSHYLKLMRIDDIAERRFYEIEAMANNWSLRELQRQCDSALYQRLALSRNKKAVKMLSEKGHVIENPEDALKDPYILEFTGLPETPAYSESDLEQKLIDKLQHFLLELGKGFTFVGRQVRFTFDEDHFKVDLVFYNRLLQCFVLIDLKIGKLKHQDLGQMQMYVNYYDRHVRLENENKTIGIILCQDKNETLVKITLQEGNQQIFASKYQTILPSKEALKRLIGKGRYHES